MKVAVIGAGYAGLSALRYLHEFGHDVTLFEKVGDVGGVWSGTRTYPGISTQNNKGTYHLSDFRMPKHYPEWPSGPQVQAYLDSYVDKFGLRPFLRLNTEVLETKQEEDDRWTLTTKDGTETFDYLVAATGIYSRAKVPNFPGADEFRAAGGTICHTSEFEDMEMVRGKNAIVVGYGKSACDVAATIGRVTGSTTLVARDLIWKCPKRLPLGINNKYLLLTRFGESLFRYIRPQGFEKFMHGAGKPIRDTMMNTVEKIVLHQCKLKKLGLVPEGRFERVARANVSLVSDGFYDLAEQGKINVERDTEIKQLLVEGDQRYAVLGNGKKVPADHIICGTGWSQEIACFDDETKARFMDERGNYRLYKCVMPVDVNNLFFNGFNSSFFSALSAEMGALWICAYLDGQLKLPPESEMKRLTDERLAWQEQRTEGKHARGTNIIPFSLHQIDELLEDMMLPVPPGQRMLEWLIPVRPAAYTKIFKRLKARVAERRGQAVSRPLGNAPIKDVALG